MTKANEMVFNNKANEKFNVVLFSNYDSMYCDCDYNDYLEYCKHMEYIPLDRYSWEANEEVLDWGILMDELDEIKGEFVMSGSVGLWSGKSATGIIHYTHLSDAVTDAIRDCDYYSVELKNGVLVVTASHHDGTNVFDIKMLTQKGCSVSQWYERKEATIFELPNGYTKRMSIDDVYGR